MKKPLINDLDGNAKTEVKGPAEKSSSYKLFWAMAMLCSGTCTTLFAKGLFETKADGEDYCNKSDDDDKHCQFNKPWFTVVLMKVAMTLCLGLYYGLGWGKENPNAPNPSWTTIKAVAFPASLDLLGTVLGNVGLLWVDSSIYQMTRGSVVVFSAILSVKFLGRKLRSFHYWAIIFVIIAVILVGLAGIESGSGSTGGSEVILGLGLILLAQAVGAVQFIAEENLMNNPNTTLDPVALVGYEGLWGILYFIVLAPILTATPRSSMAISSVWHENFIDTFVQLSNSSGLCLLSFGYFCAIIVYNVSANFVTQCLSAVVRSILEACRVMGVWIMCLLFFYVGTSTVEAIGEKWTNWSFLQLFGFMCLLYGTFAYKGLVKIPWVSQDVYDQAARDDHQNAIATTSYQKLSHDDGYA
jgi:drug/metabolite transporter (DMT)-like permease